MPLIERLAGFGRTEQGFQLCFDWKKLFGSRPLIEPVDERIYGNEKQCGCDFGVGIDWQTPGGDHQADKPRKNVPPQHRPQ